MIIVYFTHMKRISYVNGNFIPDGSREELFTDIQWNLYLMEEAGKLFIKWISDMIKEFDNPSHLYIHLLY